MIRNGMGIPMLQQIIIDDGLHDPKVVPLGGDKVFLYHSDKETSEEVYSLTVDFFL